MSGESAKEWGVTTKEALIGINRLAALLRRWARAQTLVCVCGNHTMLSDASSPDELLADRIHLQAVCAEDRAQRRG